MHLATQGFSPRTRHDAQLIRFGESAAAVSLTLSHERVVHRVEVRVSDGIARTAELDGARVASSDALRRDLPTLVFTPDRLSVIKGGPGVRRAYFDRVLTRLQPARSAIPAEYSATLQQRNAALRRVQLGISHRSSLEPWTQRAAELGGALVESRRAVMAALLPGFRERLDEFGVPDGSLSYPSEPPTLAELERRLESDIAAGVTGLGPHRDDVLISSAGHDLRSFGVAGAATAHPARALARRGGTRAGLPAAAARRRALGARRAPPRRSRPRRRASRANACDSHAPLGPPGGAGADRGGEPWTGSLTRSAARLGRLAPRRTSLRSPNAGRRRSARQLPATPGRRGSPAMARCTSTPRTRSGPSSSPSAPARSQAGSARPRFASPQDRWPARQRAGGQAGSRGGADASSDRRAASGGRGDRCRDRGPRAAQKCAKSGRPGPRARLTNHPF